MNFLLKNKNLFFSIFLSFLVLHNTLRVSFTYIYYSIDPIGFIEELCENKDAPELQCNGKCELTKVIETNSPKENTPLQIIDFKDILLYQNLISAYNFKENITQKLPLFIYQNCYQYAAIHSCFHPPENKFL